MTNAASPTRFSGEMDHFYDPTFTQEISQKMRVPKRIKFDGETEDEVRNNLPPNSWTQSSEKFEMHVPDRILVIGQDEHFGTRAPPPEQQLENAVMPHEPEMIRIQTPPRVLTLDDHYFPAAYDDFQTQNSAEPMNVGMAPLGRTLPQKTMDLSAEPRDFVPSVSEGMSTGEEVVHLRRQLAKLNRRVMNLELSCLQQQQREKIFYAVVTAYFLVKGLMWLNRS